MILIGIFIIGLISSGLAIFISSGAGTYTLSGYDNDSLDSFNKMTELNSKIESYNNDSGTVGSDSGDDKLGSLFTSTYQSASTLKDSIGIFGSMINDGIGNVKILGGYGEILKKGLIGILLTAILIGIFMAFITKSERN